MTNIFVRDLQLQTTTLVSRQSVADGGAGADDNANGPAISADGRHVAFHSFADNLSAEDNAIRDIFVRDLQAQTTTLVSRQSAGDGGAAGDGNSVSVAISDNGRVVAFTSGAGNLSAEDGAFTDLFVRDLDAATTTLANRATGPAGAVGDASVFTPTLSADGRAVAFISSANNFSTEDDDAVDNVFVRDLAANTTTLVSRADGVAGAGADDGGTSRASISADGRHVAFDATADNHSRDDADFTVDVFVRDLSAATTRLVSRAAGPAGAGGDDSSDDPVISAGGRYVAFESGADNLSDQDDNLVDALSVVAPRQ